MPCRPIRSAQKGSSMVKAGPEEPDSSHHGGRDGDGHAVDDVHERNADGGLDRVRTLGMVFVHSTRSSAPARSSAWAAPASRAPASAYLPAPCSSSTSAKSADHNSSGAECSPPRRARVSSFANRKYSTVDAQFIPPRSPRTFTGPSWSPDRRTFSLSSEQVVRRALERRLPAIPRRTRVATRAERRGDRPVPEGRPLGGRRRGWRSRRR